MSEVLVRSEEHAAMRHKRITGSRIATIMRGTPVGWDTLSAQLHNPEPEKFFTPEESPKMPDQLKRGIKYEPMARAEFLMRHVEYELERPTFVVPRADFEDEDLTPWIGISPDGMLMHTGTGPDAENGGAETKVPSMETHLDWIEAGVLPAEYLPQCGISLLVTGLSHWWFISFCPEIDEDDDRRYFEIRLEREQTIIYLDTMRAKIREFLEGHVNHRLFNKMPIVQTGGFPVIEWDITDARIKVLLEEYGKLTEPSNSSDYAVVKAAHLDLVKRRTGVDKAYARATEAARDYTTGAKTEQKRLQGLMAKTEATLKTYRGDWEAEQKRKKDEAAKLKAAKVEYLQACVDAIGLLSEDLHTMTSEEIESQMDEFRAIEISDDYLEFKPQAQNALDALLFRAEAIRLDKIKKEAAAAEAARAQAEKDAELERLQKEAVERKKREAAEKTKRDAVEAARKLKEAAELEKRKRQDKIRDNQARINSSLIDVMTLDIEPGQDILDWLLEISPGDGQYGDDPDDVAALVQRAVTAVELILENKQQELERKQRELDAEAELEESSKVALGAIAERSKVALGAIAGSNKAALGAIKTASDAALSTVAENGASAILDVDNAETRQEPLEQSIDADHVADVESAEMLHVEMKSIQAAVPEAITKKGREIFETCNIALATAISALEYFINE